MKNRHANFYFMLFEMTISLLQLGEGAEFEGDMLHADLFWFWYGRAGVGFAQREHVMIVEDIGAEKQHAAVVLSDLWEAEHFSEELARTLEVFDFKNQVADPSNFK